jgi:biotin synthase
VTLSCGEQSFKTYKEWFEAGARRYLLRIETSNPKLYQRIHPNDEKHTFNNRITALSNLKAAAYQVGSGMMIGLPGQTIEDLADDLIFLQKIDIDMVGMGPYVEHIDTPMYDEKDKLLSQEERYQLTLVMFALLRIMMKDINIASTTALDALNPKGRIEALEIASNVIMPNLTPVQYTENYHLYNNKPDSMHSDELVKHIQNTSMLNGNLIAFGEHGDSTHYINRLKSSKSTKP